jgi:hypothetical protein
MTVGELRQMIRPLTDEAKILIDGGGPVEAFLLMPIATEIKLIDGEGFLVCRTMVSPYKRMLLLPPGVQRSLERSPLGTDYHRD